MRPPIAGVYRWVMGVAALTAALHRSISGVMWKNSPCLVGSLASVVHAAPSSVATARPAVRRSARSASVRGLDASAAADLLQQTSADTLFTDLLVSPFTGS